MLPEKRNAALHRKVFRKNTTPWGWRFFDENRMPDLAVQKSGELLLQQESGTERVGRGEYQLEVLEL